MSDHGCALAHMSSAIYVRFMSFTPAYAPTEGLLCLQKRTCGPLIGGAEEEEVKGSAELATGLSAAHTLSAVLFVVKVICLCSMPGTAAATSRLMQHGATAFGSQPLYSTHKHCTQFALAVSLPWHVNQLPAVSRHRIM